MSHNARIRSANANLADAPFGLHDPKQEGVLVKILATIWSAFVICALPATACAQSQVIVCDVNLSGRLALSREGIVDVDMVGAGIVNICSVVAGDRGVPKEACSGWYSTLLSLRMTKFRARFYFNTTEAGNTGMNTCADLGDWTAHTPYFLEMY